MNGFISTEEISDAEAVRRAKEFVFVGVDYVKEVTHKKAFRWDEKDEQSAAFELVRGSETGDARKLAQAAAAGGHSHRRVRLRDEIQHPAPAAAAWFRGAGVARDRHGGRCAQATSPPGIFLSNGPGDPAALDYIVREVKTLRRHRHSDFWHLPRPPDSRSGVWRKNLQTEIRPSRRQPAGEGPGNRQGRNHLAKPRFRGGSEKPAAGRRGEPHQFERPDRRRYAPQDQAGFLRAIPSRSVARPA